MGKRSFSILAVFAVVAAIAPSVSRGIVITPPDSTYDTWIRQTGPGVAFIDDGLWMAVPGSPYDAGVRYGVVQFNISGVAQPITSAWLELKPKSNGGGAAAGTVLAPAAWVNSTIQGGPVGNLTYADYELFLQPSEASFTALGGGDFHNAVVPNGVYGLSASASAADLSVLNTIRTGDGIITMIFKSASGGREFTDNSPYGEFNPVKLVINQAAPVQGDLDGDFDVDLVDYGILKTNWMATVPTGTLGDFNGTGKVTLIDFSIFKGHYQSFSPGAGELAPVPEPSTLILFAAALPALCWVIRRRKSA